jgi:hypothetical protein
MTKTEAIVRAERIVRLIAPSCSLAKRDLSETKEFLAEAHGSRMYHMTESMILTRNSGEWKGIESH